MAATKTISSTASRTRLFHSRNTVPESETVPPPAFDSTYFKQKLREQRVQLQLTQKELGERLGRSNSTIAEWENPSKPNFVPTIDQLFQIAIALNTSVADLIGVATHDFAVNGLRWRQEVPKHFSEPMQAQMQLAIEAFHLLLQAGATEEGVAHQMGDVPVQTIREYLRYAFRQGVITITEVPFRSDLETRLLNSYKHCGLKDVVVVDACGPIDHKVIRAEMIAFAVARHVLDRYAVSAGHIGLGDGYTVNRCVSLMLPTMQIQQQLKVTPLVVSTDTANVDWDSAMLNAVVFQSQMYGTMLARPQTERNDIEAIQRELDKYVERLGLILVTPRRHTQENESNPANESMYMPDARPEETSMGNHLDNTSSRMRSSADLLHQRIGADSSEPQYLRDHIAAYKLKNLRASTAALRQVWIAASGSRKQQGVELALKNKLVNGIVIDSEIAEYLLHL